MPTGSEIRSGPVRRSGIFWLIRSGPVRQADFAGSPDLNAKFKISKIGKNIHMKTRILSLNCKHDYTGSNVTGSSVTGSSVTGSSMPLQDHMCLYRIKCALHRIWSTALLFWFTTLPFVCIRLCSNFVCIMATSRKKSEVWEHFTEEPGTSFALCRVCHGFDGHNNNCLKLRR